MGLDKTVQLLKYTCKGKVTILESLDLFYTVHLKSIYVKGN